MERARVVFARTAQDDIQEIYEGVLLKSRSAATADGYILRLEERCRRIGNVPQGVRLRPEFRRDIRIVPFEDTLVIAYRYEAGVVTITNVFSTQRDYEAMLRDPSSDD